MQRELPTPRLVLDALTVQRNVRRMAEYAAAHGINLRPHTKTHKSVKIAQMQLEAGAVGLTVAKVGEAQCMSSVANDLLMAYPAVDPLRCRHLAELAKTVTLRVAIDSRRAAEALSTAAGYADTTIGILVDVDVGQHRTGVQTPDESLRLAQYVDGLLCVHLDGIMFFPGHLSDPSTAEPKLREVDQLLAEVVELWKRHGLDAAIVSGGSTPTARLSHCMATLTEIRPGTFVFCDMTCVRGGYASIDDCAARVVCTVVSDAVPGQVVIDAGSKTLTSDLCGPAPSSGHGYVVEFPEARISRLNEEHGQVDVTACNSVPKVGDRLTVIPNHICPCTNLHDTVWWLEQGEERPIRVDARGKVF